MALRREPKEEFDTVSNAILKSLDQINKPNEETKALQDLVDLCISDTYLN